MENENELLRRIEYLERALVTDSLTGAHNRYYFFNKIDLKHYQSWLMYFIDLDNFKEINDDYGHAYGDQVLVRFACDLGQCLEVDDLLIRYAGDEFIIIAKEERNLKSNFIFSQGFVIIDGLDRSLMLEAADRAMYLNKHLKVKND